MTAEMLFMFLHQLHSVLAINITQLICGNTSEWNGIKKNKTKTFCAVTMGAGAGKAGWRNPAVYFDR